MPQQWQLRHIGAHARPISSAFVPGTSVEDRALIREILRVGPIMADRKSNGYLGALLGGIVAVAALVFLLSGGEWGGKKSVKGDEDLPPVAATTK